MKMKDLIKKLQGLNLPETEVVLKNYYGHKNKEFEVRINSEENVVLLDAHWHSERGDE